MRKGILYGLLLLICVLTSCSKDIAPTISAMEKGKAYDSADFDYCFVEAIKQKYLGNSGDALRRFEHCAEINPKSDAVYYQITQIILANGDINNAKKYLRKAIELRPDNIWYIMMMGGIYYKEHNVDSAIIYYENAVKEYPEKIDIKLTLGSLYSEIMKYDKADAVFDSIDEKYGINEKSTLANVRNLMIAGKYDDAQELVEKLIKKYPDQILYSGLLAEIYRARGENTKAMDVYNRLIENNPDNPEAQLALCDFLLKENKFEELLMLIDKIILNKGVSRDDKISLFAEMLENKSFVEKYGQKAELSIIGLEEMYPGDELIQLLRPELLIRKEDLRGASVRLEEIIVTNPDYYFAWEKLLLVYLQAGDYKNLEIKAKECSSKFNRSFIAKMLYASAATENEKYNIALEEVRKAEILAGANKDMIIQVLSVRADIYYRMENYKKTFEILEEALKTDNSDLTILNNYAYYLAEQDLNLKRAEEMARKVIEKEKDNNTFLDTYGWVLYKRGKIREAEKVMQSVIDSGEKPDAEWYEHMGYIKKKRKKWIEAIENWNIAIKLDSKKSELINEIEKCQKEF